MSTYLALFQNILRLYHEFQNPFKLLFFKSCFKDNVPIVLLFIIDPIGCKLSHS